MANNQYATPISQRPSGYRSANSPAQSHMGQMNSNSDLGQIYQDQISSA